MDFGRTSWLSSVWGFEPTHCVAFKNDRSVHKGQDITNKFRI